MSELVNHFRDQSDAMLALLRELVEIESPSHDRTATNRVGAAVAGMMRSAGATVERFPQDGVGDAILGRWTGGAARRQVLLLCHLDTVWPLGTLADRPVRVDQGRFFGPGAFDMKAGITIALAALKRLNLPSLRPVADILMLCNADEEIGSPASRALIEELASASALVLCLEPAIPGGALKTARKGVASYTLTAKGRSAHAGADHANGINAIEEIAHQVLKLQAMTDYVQGTTANVGRIAGGSATNVVPAECEIKVDIRVTSVEEAERIARIMAGFQSRLPGTELTVEGGLSHPPMVRDDLMARTFAQVQRIGSRHGLEIAEGSTGGGSDGSIAAALGVPTVDGLGADGDGGHAVHEHVRVSSLPDKAALLAAVLTEWEFDA